MNRFLLGIILGIAAFVALFINNAAFANGACGPKQTEMLYTVTLVSSGNGTGSGTVVYSNKTKSDEWESYVLTNFHVIESAIKISKEWSPKEGKKVETERRDLVKVNWFDYNDCSRSIGTRGKVAEIAAYDKQADLALLKIQDTERGVAPVAHLFPENEVPLIGDHIFAVGAGLGEPPFMTEGALAFLDKQVDGYRYILSTAPIIFGNSGGALFRWSVDRKRYEFIGVPSAVSVAGWNLPVTHMGWVVPMETIRKFLRDNDKSQILETK